MSIKMKSHKALQLSGYCIYQLVNMEEKICVCMCVCVNMHTRSTVCWLPTSLPSTCSLCIRAVLYAGCPLRYLPRALCAYSQYCMPVAHFFTFHVLSVHTRSIVCWLPTSLFFYPSVAFRALALVILVLLLSK